MSQETGPTVAHGPRMVAGRYAIMNELGRGGMGVVWLAEDTMIGRHVAIKELHLPEGVPHSEREIFEQRVLREARTAGRLNDPAVVTVFDVVQESGATFIVMELIQAPTLSDVVKQSGPLPADQVAKLADQLLSALDAAHQAGIVHRDVKPSNIMLAANGRVKLTDFGIAQSLDDPRLTSSGILIGSPSYMAPERIRGEEASASSDLWALGAVLFFAMEGYSPYDRTTTAAVMHSILNDVPYLTRGQGALASVITGLMINTPAARLTSGQVRSLLGHVQTAPQTGQTVMAGGTAYFPHNHQTHAVAAPRPGLGKNMAITLAVVVALVAGVAGYFLNELVTSIGSDPTRTAAETYTYGEGGDVVDFALSDGVCNAGALQPNADFSSGDPCTEPFRFQVFDIVDAGNSSERYGYFGSDLKALGTSYCGWLFQTERIKNENGSKAKLVYSVVVPSEKAWQGNVGKNDGKRGIYCVLRDENGALLTSSQVQDRN